MPSKGWMQIRGEVPVRFSEETFFTDAQIMESKLGRISPYQEPDKALTSIIDKKVEFDGIVQEVLRQIYSVYQQIDEYEDVTETIYRLIELNLTHYRMKRIDSIIQDASDRSNRAGSAAINPHNVQVLRSNMLSLLNMIKNSINAANRHFEYREEDSEVDSRIVYIATLAKHFESSIKYYAKVDIGGEDEGLMDVVEGAAEGGEDAAEKLEEYSEEMDEIEEEISEAEEQLEQL